LSALTLLPPKNPLNGLLPLDDDFLTGCVDVTTDDDAAGFFCPAGPVPPPKRLNVGRFFVTAAPLVEEDSDDFFFVDACFKLTWLLLFAETEFLAGAADFFFEPDGDCFGAPPMPNILRVGDFFLGCAVVAFLVGGCFTDFLGAEDVPNSDIVGERFTGEENAVPFATTAGVFLMTCFFLGPTAAGAVVGFFKESNRLIVGERFAGSLLLGDFAEEGDFLEGVALLDAKKENISPPLELFVAGDATLGVCCFTFFCC